MSILCTLPLYSHAASSASVDHTQSVAITKSGSFASLSDIHFDPFYDPTLVNKLIQTNYTEWKTSFSSSKIKSYSPYGKDTNYPLLNSALLYAAQVAKDAEFVIISGDFCPITLMRTITHITGNTKPKALHYFINKTIAFVTLMISEFFPNIPVYPVVGNNDSYCCFPSMGVFIFQVPINAWSTRDPRDVSSFSTRSHAAVPGLPVIAAEFEPKNV